MENNRGQSIFLSVVGIATLLVAIVGATFAYFSITVRGNDTASSIRVTTAQVGGVVYSDGTDLISVTDAYPGWSATKTFTVATEGAMDANAEIAYQIVLQTTNAELSAAANNGTYNDFGYSLTPNGSATGSGTMAASVTNRAMPTTTADVIIGTGTLKGVDSHTYNFSVLLRESGSDQNQLQGKTYTGKVVILIAGGDGQWRTYAANESGWRVYNTTGESTSPAVTPAS